MPTLKMGRGEDGQKIMRPNDDTIHVDIADSVHKGNYIFPDGAVLEVKYDGKWENLCKIAGDRLNMEFLEDELDKIRLGNWISSDFYEEGQYGEIKREIYKYKDKRVIIITDKDGIATISEDFPQIMDFGVTAQEAMDNLSKAFLEDKQCK
jgi:hypothetical protein